MYHGIKNGIYVEHFKNIGFDSIIEKRPSIYHELNESKDSWDFNRESWLNEEIRPRRNELLDECDLKYCNAFIELNPPPGV